MVKLSLEDVQWTVRPVYEYEWPADCFDDAETVRWVNEQLALGNDWAWCCVEVTGHYKGLTESDSLGCCSYRSEEDFRRDGYYRDMQLEILDRLNSQVEEIISEYKQRRFNQINLLCGV